MARWQLEKVAVVHLMEAAKTVLDHLRDFTMQGIPQELGAARHPTQTYAQLRRLRTHLQRCASAYGDPVELDLGDEDQNLFVSVAIYEISSIDRALTAPHLDSSEAEWLEERRRVMAQWAVEFATRRVTHIPVGDDAQLATPTVHLVLRDIQRRLVADSTRAGMHRVMRDTTGFRQGTLGPSPSPAYGAPRVAPPPGLGHAPPGPTGVDDGWGPPSGPAHPHPAHPNPVHPQPAQPQRPQPQRPQPQRPQPPRPRPQPQRALTPSPHRTTEPADPEGGTALPPIETVYKDDAYAPPPAPTSPLLGTETRDGAAHQSGTHRVASQHGAPHHPSPSAAPPADEPGAHQDAVHDQLEAQSELEDFDPKRVREPRLRALVNLDLRAYQRASAAGDHRLTLVHLSSLLEGVCIDYALPRRRELGLSGSPENWSLEVILRSAMSDQMTSLDRGFLFHLAAARNLLRPAMQLANPMVVTHSTEQQLTAFVRKVLAQLGLAGSFAEPAASGALLPGSGRQHPSDEWS